MKTTWDDVLTWNLTELANSIGAKEISPVEITRLLLEKIYESDRKFNSYITVMEESAIASAKEAETEILLGNIKGPLHGVPVAVKDNVFVKGIKNTSGSAVYKDYVPTEDAELVRRLTDSGAVIIGKTNMHEFAAGGTGDRSYFGPSRNPLDPTKITGGSSSGSAAAVAGHLAYAAIGSDTVGSIRIPSACCGLVGMKPTFGSISRYGTVPLSPSMDHFGPITKTVGDNALVLDALIGYDTKDTRSAYHEKENDLEPILQPAKELCIGIPDDFCDDMLQNEVRESFYETIDILKQHGIKVKMLKIDVLDELQNVHPTILGPEMFSSFEDDVKNRAHRIDEEVLSFLTWGTDVKASTYIQALKKRRSAVKSFHHIFNQVDLILTPTISILPTRINQRKMIIEGVETRIDHILGRLTFLANITGFPAISVPGIPKNDLPVGLQFIGPPYSERTLYLFSSLIENII